MKSILDTEGLLLKSIGVDLSHWQLKLRAGELKTDTKKPWPNVIICEWQLDALSDRLI